MKKVILYASIASLLATIASAQNADVTWQSPLTISGASDVNTDGTLFGTWAPGDDYYGDFNSVPENYTANGVAFNTYGTPGDNFNAASTSTDRYNGFANPGTGDSIYNNLLQVAIYNNNTDNIILSWNGMTAGNTYLVELWANDGRGNDRTQTFTGGANTSAALTIAPGAGGPGQFIIGTFVADGSGSETISLAAGAGGNYGPMLNLVQVRDISPVPEPSTLAFLALGAAAVSYGFRRKYGTI